MSEPVSALRVEIAPLNLTTLQALLDGDLAAARRSSGLALPDAFVAADWRSTWRYRRDQVAADPAVAGWVTGAVCDRDSATVVGRAGFHGPPDDRGLVEIGYAIDPARRRRGWGRAAVTALLVRSVAEPSVHVVRASISPDNLASQRLIAPFGFVVVGDQWDDEDGLEVVWEVPADEITFT